MTEIWKDLFDNSNYEVNTLGVFIRKERTIRLERKGIPHTRVLKRKKVATHVNKKTGYLYINIDGTTKTVHRLLALTFIPNNNPEENIFVNHIDGNKLNNTLDNLEWVTPNENVQHAYDNELMIGTLGERTKNAKLTPDDVLSIKWMLENDNMTQEEIASQFGVSRTVISCIKRGVSWSYVTGYEYNGRTEKFKGKVRNYVKKV